MTSRESPASSRLATGTRYEGAFRAAPMGVALIDARDPAAPHFLEVNAPFAALFGHDAEALTGMTMTDLTHPSDQARSEDAVRRQILQGDDVVRVEKRFVRRDGSVFWGVSLRSLVRDEHDDPDFWVVHVSDVSDRKQAEGELGRRLDQLEQSQRHANIGSFEVELSSRAARLSDQLYRIIGRQPGGAAPTVDGLLAAVHPDDRHLVRAVLDHPERPHLVEYRFTRPDGRMVVLQATVGPVADETGRADGVTGTIRDVTQQRALEGALHVSERMHLAFEVSPLAQLLLSIDERPASVVYANVAAAELTGRGTGSLTGLALADVTGAGALPDGLGRVLRLESTSFTGELEIATATGTTTVAADARVVAGGDTGRAFVLLTLRERLPSQDDAAPPTSISERERDVLELVAQGAGGQEIASALHLSPETVKTHLRRIYYKLGVNDRAAAVARALRSGLID